MSDNTEFLAAIHSISTGANELCDITEKILKDNNAPYITVPAAGLQSIVDVLRAQTKIATRLVEENARIMDLIEDAVRKTEE